MHIIALIKALKHNNHRVSFNKEFRKDISWCINFIGVYNGVSLILNVPWSAPDHVFAIDACLNGCGGLCSTNIVHANFPDWVLAQFPAIHHLEFMAPLVAIRLRGSQWSG